MLIFTGCAQHPSKQKHLNLGATHGFYFPEDKIDEFRNKWYSWHLATASEPVLFSSADRGLEIYRFLWLRTFHNPIVLRITKTADATYLTVKRLDGKGGYSPGKIDVDTQKPISASQWNKFRALLSDSSFWDMPSKEPKKQFARADGALWILEGVHRRRYHFVHRHIIEDEPNFQKICLYLLSLSEIQLKKEEIY
jgi:hypothetical protein